MEVGENFHQPESKFGWAWTKQSTETSAAENSLLLVGGQYKGRDDFRTKFAKLIIKMTAWDNNINNLVLFDYEISETYSAQIGFTHPREQMMVLKNVESGSCLWISYAHNLMYSVKLKTTDPISLFEAR